MVVAEEGEEATSFVTVFYGAVDCLAKRRMSLPLTGPAGQPDRKVVSSEVIPA